MGRDDGQNDIERERREESAIRRLLNAIGEIAGEGERADRGALCRRSGITDNAVGVVLDALEARGLVEIRWEPMRGTRCIRVVATGAKTAGFDEALRTKPRKRASRAGGESKPVTKKQEARKKRKCMACDIEFVSTGPGHRLCRQHRHGMDGVAVHRIAAMR